MRTADRPRATPKAVLPAAAPPPRAVIDAVLPSIDGGRFAVKRIAGEPLEVIAHCFTDGHDRLRVRLCWHAEGEAAVHEVEMAHRGNDEWFASFIAPLPGRYLYTVCAWVDHFLSWREDFTRRVDAADLRLAARVGAQLIEQTAARAAGAERKRLLSWATALRTQAADASGDIAALRLLAEDEAGAHLVAQHPDRRHACRHEPELPLRADRVRAGFGNWYELFPRSASPEPGRHGRFADVQARLPELAEMGVDVLYLPPIHPIGRVHRKGRNNALVAEPGDVGSPWAIGAEEGGHKAILPELGTAEDFRSLVAAAAERGIEIALDIAFQCAPDHPYVKAHPQWFRARPDGSIQYAENPPKKYQDIFPFDFETDDWAALWQELKSIFEHWIGQGVRIFRVDNPHTKAFAFWEWVIGELQRAHPDVLFLAEAFTRPKVMHRLAKLGFSQSYTYFTWRNTRQELTAYFTELAHGRGRDHFRPNAWPNTPDILNEHLHGASRAVFGSRLALAATLSPNYGIYGPAYELMENRPREPGSEEYLDSEKYQLRHWDLDRPDSLRGLVGAINRIRRENRALHSLHGLQFLETGNEQLVAYARRSPADDNLLLVVVNLDPVNRQSGWIEGLDTAFPIDTSLPYRMHDLVSEQRFLWQGPRGFVILDPQQAPAHVMRLHQTRASERRFESAP